MAKNSKFAENAKFGVFMIIRLPRRLVRVIFNFHYVFVIFIKEMLITKPELTTKKFLIKKHW